MMEDITKSEGNLKIETIKGPKNGQVSRCPERGDIITSMKLNGKEILYLDEGTFKDINANVKGGIPILFPNAGPIAEGSQFPNLEQHGFARKAKWKSENTDEGFRDTLIPSAEAKKAFPYNFRFSMLGNFEKDGSFTLTQEVENKEEERNLPISMGLHPYFKVSNSEKTNIKFNFDGGKLVEEEVESWANGKAIKAISIDNPNVPMEIVIPGMGTLIINVSPEFKKIWVWTMAGKDFICVEPVMRNANGLIDDPEKVKPKEKFSATMNLKLIE